MLHNPIEYMVIVKVFSSLILEIVTLTRAENIEESNPQKIPIQKFLDFS